MPLTKDINQIWKSLGSFWDRFEQKDTISAAWEGYLELAEFTIQRNHAIRLSKSLHFMPGIIKEKTPSFAIVFSGENPNVYTSHSGDIIFETPYNYMASIPNLINISDPNYWNASGEEHQVLTEGTQYDILDGSRLVFEKLYDPPGAYPDNYVVKVDESMRPLVDYVELNAPYIYRHNPILWEVWAPQVGLTLDSLNHEEYRPFKDSSEYTYTDVGNDLIQGTGTFNKAAHIDDWVESDAAEGTLSIFSGKLKWEISSSSVDNPHIYLPITGQSAQSLAKFNGPAVEAGRWYRLSFDFEELVAPNNPTFRIAITNNYDWDDSSNTVIYYMDGAPNSPFSLGSGDTGSHEIIFQAPGVDDQNFTNTSRLVLVVTAANVTTGTATLDNITLYKLAPTQLEKLEDQAEHYKFLIWGLASTMSKGPSVKQIKIGASIASGLPFAYDSGVVSTVVSNTPTNYDTVTVTSVDSPGGSRDYIIPTSLTNKATIFTDSTCDYNTGGLASIVVSMDDTSNVRAGMSVSGDYLGTNSVDKVVDATTFNLTRLPSEVTAVVDGTLTFATIVDKFQPLCDGIDVWDYKNNLPEVQQFSDYPPALANGNSRFDLLDVNAVIFNDTFDRVEIYVGIKEFTPYLAGTKTRIETVHNHGLVVGNIIEITGSYTDTYNGTYAGSDSWTIEGPVYDGIGGDPYFSINQAYVPNTQYSGGTIHYLSGDFAVIDEATYTLSSGKLLVNWNPVETAGTGVFSNVTNIVKSGTSQRMVLTGTSANTGIIRDGVSLTSNQTYRIRGSFYNASGIDINAIFKVESATGTDSRWFNLSGASSSKVNMDLKFQKWVDIDLLWTNDIGTHADFKFSVLHDSTYTGVVDLYIDNIVVEDVNFLDWVEHDTNASYVRPVMVATPEDASVYEQMCEMKNVANDVPYIEQPNILQDYAAGDLVSIIGDGTTLLATVDVSRLHSIQEGDFINVAGTGNYNGDFEITEVKANGVLSADTTVNAASETSGDVIHNQFYKIVLEMKTDTLTNATGSVRVELGSSVVNITPTLVFDTYTIFVKNETGNTDFQVSNQGDGCTLTFRKVDVIRKNPEGIYNRAGHIVLNRDSQIPTSTIFYNTDFYESFVEDLFSKSYNVHFTYKEIT